MGWQYIPDLYTEVEVIEQCNIIYGVYHGGSIDWLWDSISPEKLKDIVNTLVLLYHQDEKEITNEEDLITEAIRFVMYKENYNKIFSIINEVQ